MISQETRTKSSPSPSSSYLVRLWQDDQQQPWRASAQSVHTGEILMFATVEELYFFLREQTRAEPPLENSQP